MQITLNKNYVNSNNALVWNGNYQARAFEYTLVNISVQLGRGTCPPVPNTPSCFLF